MKVLQVAHCGTNKCFLFIFVFSVNVICTVKRNETNNKVDIFIYWIAEDE